ncbi:MAG TPA: zinc ribbon domain-containing protein [bacterium]|nr:zinc ribbon domain-containing protein [bacterium]
MPSYTYECDKCGLVDVRQPITEPPHRKCPQCGGEKVRRIIGAGGGILTRGSAPQQQHGCGGCPHGKACGRE